VESAELCDHVLAGPEMQVVRVAEDDRRPEVAQLERVDHLHGRLRPHGHEGRRRHLAVHGAEDARACFAVRGRDLEAHRSSIASPKE
jgi:hypothetical protein